MGDLQTFLLILSCVVIKKLFITNIKQLPCMCESWFLRKSECRENETKHACMKLYKMHFFARLTSLRVLCCCYMFHFIILEGKLIIKFIFTKYELIHYFYYCDQNYYYFAPLNLKNFLKFILGEILIVLLLLSINDILNS